MKIEIRDKMSGEVLMSLTIPFHQNPKEAVLNVCRNMGYMFTDVSWNAR